MGGKGGGREGGEKEKKVKEETKWGREMKEVNGVY